MLKIRPATPKDMDALLRLGHQMMAEGSYRDAGFCPDTARNFVNAFLNGARELVLVFEEDDEVYGMFMAAAMQMFFSKAKVTGDYVFYVTPEKRAEVPLRSLIKTYRNWAEGHGVIRLSLSQSTGDEIDKFRRMGECLGFEAVGYNMKMDL